MSTRMDGPFDDHQDDCASCGASFVDCCEGVMVARTACCEPCRQGDTHTVAPHKHIPHDCTPNTCSACGRSKFDPVHDLSTESAERDAVEGTTSPLDTGELRRWDGEVPARVLLGRAADELDWLRAAVPSDDLRATIGAVDLLLQGWRDAVADASGLDDGQLIRCADELDAALAASTGDREATDEKPKAERVWRCGVACDMRYGRCTPEHQHHDIFCGWVDAGADR